MLSGSRGHTRPRVVPSQDLSSCSVPSGWGQQGDPNPQQSLREECCCWALSLGVGELHCTLLLGFGASPLCCFCRGGGRQRLPR